MGQMEQRSCESVAPCLPAGHAPRLPKGIEIERIVLTRGSLASPEREAFVRRICESCPDAPVEERLNLAHNRVDLGERDPLGRLQRGKRTLVLGELNPKNAVWPNPTPGGMYPYRRFFSTYGLCPFRCSYCYLNATPSAAFAPSVKIHVNLPEIMSELDRQANEAGTPIIFYSGKMHDSLALDTLTAYSTVLVPFFARHPLARLVMQTKSARVEHLLTLAHGNHTALSWTLTPPALASMFEPGAAANEERLAAMEQCAARGYPVCANIAPILQTDGWEELYFQLVRDTTARVPVRRIFFGGMYLKQLSWRYFRHHVGESKTSWFVRSGQALCYRTGYAAGFFERVVRFLERSYDFESSFSDLNGGSLVIRFRHGDSFDVFPECLDEGTAIAGGFYGNKVIPATNTGVHIRPACR